MIDEMITEALADIVEAQYGNPDHGEASGTIEVPIPDDELQALEQATPGVDWDDVITLNVEYEYEWNRIEEPTGPEEYASVHEDYEVDELNFEAKAGDRDVTGALSTHLLGSIEEQIRDKIRLEDQPWLGG